MLKQAYNGEFGHSLESEIEDETQYSEDELWRPWMSELLSSRIGNEDELWRP